MDMGTDLITTPSRMDEGVHQGAVEMGWLFSMGVNRPFQQCNRNIVKYCGGMSAKVDDNYLREYPGKDFEPNMILRESVSVVGRELQLDKSKCYIDAAYHSEA